MSKDLSKIYKDDKQESVSRLKKSADKVTEYDSPFTAKDVITDIIMVIVAMIFSFGWMLVMLLIVSFVGMSYIHLKFGRMLIYSGIFSVVITGLYIYSKIKKYKKLLEKNL